MQKLSLGRQEFSRIIKDNAIYVDKTQQIDNLVQTGKVYFLSRPRRFGKSLLVNTFKELFSGHRELFQGTWIENHYNWEQKYPVIKLDFSSMNYKETNLGEALSARLHEIAENYQIPLKNTPGPASLLRELIISLSEKEGPVVLLVDEYDKPISDYLDHPEQAELHREELKNLYSPLKSLDAHIHFLFLTGVSKFSKVSIFSDLNHLTDLTRSPHAATLLGYTWNEIEKFFSDYLEFLQKKHHLTLKKLRSKMQSYYDGYSWDGENFVYNPFSVQSFFAEGYFKHFWFATGTATFLVKALKNSGRPPEKVSPLVVTEPFFDKFELKNMDIISLLFQTGYLTIKKADYEKGRYTLAFPNEEVESAFLNNLLEIWAHKVSSEKERNIASWLIEDA